MPLLHPDRLFPAEPATRAVARELYEAVRHLPILSPHGHVDPEWFARDDAFPNPTALFLLPDHYILRMLYSQGVPMEQLKAGAAPEHARAAWTLFAANYFLFRGTPTRIWLDYAFQELFGLGERLSPATADLYWETITEALQSPEMRPRRLFERFRLEVLATTDSALSTLEAHQAIRGSGWTGRVLPTFRPDAAVDPSASEFERGLQELGAMTGEDTGQWQGYLRALRKRREQFRALGCTATDHGHPTAATADLPAGEAERLYGRVASGVSSAADQELFRAQMLTEMARMSLEDGLVMQLHPGSFRNHNPELFARWGPDAGADIPMPTDYVRGLRPLLARFGNDPRLRLIVFTLDESTYSRELAPLAGHYPALRLGPPWWFHDSPEGMRRFRERVTETAGFYNTVGFNDDTRAFLSIPARHDMARRQDAAYLATLVADHRLERDEAFDLIRELAGPIVRRAYRLDEHPRS